MIKFVQKINGHNRSEVTNLIENPYHKDSVITVGHDGKIKQWHKQNLQLIRSTYIASPYLTAFTAYQQQQKFLLGIGDGSLIILNAILQVVDKHKLHEDCITSIIIQKQYIITSSHDGYVYFINKKTFHIIKQINIQMPVLQILLHQNILYMATNQGYTFNVQKNQLIKKQKTNKIIVYKNLVLGLSQRDRIICLNNPDCVLPQKIDNIECQYFINVGSELAMIANQIQGVVRYSQPDGIDQYHYYVQKQLQLQDGCSILSGFYDSNRKLLFLTGESGEIYKFKVDNLNQQYL